MSDPTDPASVPWWATLISGAGGAGLFAAVTTWIKSRTTVEVAELTAETKLQEAHIHERETTGEHVLESWKLLIADAKDARDIVRAEREALDRERMAYERARDDAAAARKQARLDQELAESAMNQNEECQEALAKIREENAKMNERLVAVEASHAECPAKIKKLENDVAYLRYLNDKKSDVPPAMEPIDLVLKHG